MVFIPAELYTAEIIIAPEFIIKDRDEPDGPEIQVTRR